MVAHKCIITLFALMLFGQAALASPEFVEQEQGAIELFKDDLNKIKTSTDQQVDFVLKTEDLGFAKNTPVTPEGTGQEPEASVPRKYQVFVSWSLGEADIKNLLLEYNQDRTVELVFRGIPDGLSLQDSLAKIQRLSLLTKSDTPVLINPVPFEESAIDVVPQVRKVEGKKTIFVVPGTTSISAAEGQFEKFKSVKLPSIGPVLKIAERDLIEVMQERLAKVDFAKLKDKALGRFWTNQTFTDLPPAPSNRTRSLDPTIIVPQEMAGADGTVIHKAGDRINPLDIRPFTQRLVIIDPSIPKQIQFARSQVEKYGRAQNVVVILSEVDRSAGWAGFTDVQDKVGHAVYILKDDVRTRFSIDYTPSVVTADNKKFYIEEISGESLP
ncbi:pilus assembly protein [Pseudomonas sp. LS-2]|nr:pilus assembly protein [Pseudomonas sp. LS-2]